MLYMEIPAKLAAQATVEVIDITGRSVFLETGRAKKEGKLAVFNLSGLPPGLYALKITCGQFVVTHKVILR